MSRRVSPATGQAYGLQRVRGCGASRGRPSTAIVTERMQPTAERPDRRARWRTRTWRG